MQNIVSLNPLYKRDSKGKVRVWTMEVGFNNDNEAGIRTISGLVDGQKVTSEWNLTEAKNVGRSNATTAKTQAEFEAQAEWTKNVDKEYFVDVNWALYCDNYLEGFHIPFVHNDLNDALEFENYDVNIFKY